MTEAMQVDDAQYNTAAGRDKGKAKASAPAVTVHGKAYSLPWVSTLVDHHRCKLALGCLYMARKSALPIPNLFSALLAAASSTFEIHAGGKIPTNSHQRHCGQHRSCLTASNHI